MYLAIDTMMSGDYAAALVESTIFDRRFEFWGPLLHGLALDGLGHPDEAHREIDAARELEPGLEVAIAGTTDLPITSATSSCQIGLGRNRGRRRPPDDAIAVTRARVPILGLADTAMVQRRLARTIPLHPQGLLTGTRLV